MTKRPSFQFYPADWQNSIKLKACSYEEKGFYIDLLCLLHQSPKYGYLTKEIEQSLPQLLGKDRRTSVRLLAKVREKSMMSVDQLTGELFNERMVEDEKFRVSRALNGALGGEFGKLGGRPKGKPLPKPLQNPPSSSSSSSSSYNNTIPNGIGEAPKVYGNEEVNKMLLALKKATSRDTFKESNQLQRRYAQHLVVLYNKIGKEEFRRRLDVILNDNFKFKNSNSLKYLHGELKSASSIEPQKLIII